MGCCTKSRRHDSLSLAAKGRHNPLAIGELVRDRLLSAQEVADFLGVPLTTLYQWRTKGTAPRAVKVGRHLRFRQVDLDAWCNRNADEPPDAA